MTALVLTGDVEVKLQYPQWRPGQPPWRLFHYCVIISSYLIDLTDSFTHFIQGYFTCTMTNVWPQWQWSNSEENQLMSVQLENGVIMIPHFSMSWRQLSVFNDWVALKHTKVQTIFVIIRMYVCEKSPAWFDNDPYWAILQAMTIIQKNISCENTKWKCSRNPDVFSREKLLKLWW